MVNAGVRLAIIASTFQQGRDVCVEGESGLLACIPESYIQDWNRSIGELTLVNGSYYRIYTGEKPSSLRGPQHHRVWADELPHWRFPEDTWDMAMMGLRLGNNPQSIITSTPLPVKVIRDLIADKHTHLTRGTTFDNRDNLPEVFYNKIIAKYEGTRLGRQELYGDLLDDIPGALWQRAWIENQRIKNVDPLEIAKQCMRVVIAIDPAVTSPKKLSASKEDEDMDETGITALGLMRNGRGVVLADDSCRESPMNWAKRSVALYKKFGADRMIGEVNNGGDLVEEVIRMVDPNISFKQVRASRGKFVRAEPIASLYEQGRISHVGTFERLEDQMCMFTPENIEKKSPDRADSLVWGFFDLFDGCRNLGLLELHKEKLAAGFKQAPPAPTQCPACQATCIAKVGGAHRCNQCGTQFGAAEMVMTLAKRNAPEPTRDTLFPGVTRRIQ